MGVSRFSGCPARLRGTGVAVLPRSWGGTRGQGGRVGAALPAVCSRRAHASFLPQNRPSVITCASASARNCNLSHCPVAHSGCAAGPASYRRTPSCECPRRAPTPLPVLFPERRPCPSTEAPGLGG